MKRGRLDDPERGALRIAEDGDAPDLGDVNRLHGRGAAELLCFRGRRVGIVDRHVRLPNVAAWLTTGGGLAQSGRALE